MKETQAVTTTVKIYFEQKMQSVKEFYQIWNEISLILHHSINQIWAVAHQLLKTQQTKQKHF